MGYKLGKLPAREDIRTIKIAKFLKAPIPSPPAFNVDMLYPFMQDKNLFGNEHWGDCVVAMKAHAIKRLEAFEQRTDLAIADAEVLAD